MENISRRNFLVRGSALSLGIANIGAISSFLPCQATANGAPVFPAPFFDLADYWMVTVRGHDLRFGSSVAPFKDPEWVLGECSDIGFTSIRISMPREHCEIGPDDGPFNPECFHNPYPEATKLLRRSNLDIVMLVKGHPADSRRVPLDWPRYSDGTINGRAASRSFASYARWLSEHTGDFVSTYELWNEAFGHIEDQDLKKSFGPGGSKVNADNYSDMMLPAVAEIKKFAPRSKILIEGNYWNISQSVAQSPGFQQLLRTADYVVKHPYGYNLLEYTKAGKTGKGGNDYEAYEYYKRINPRIQWVYTEYNVTPKTLSLSPEAMNGLIQAKAVLRSTVLHIRHGITKLFPFSLYYPSTPALTFMEKDHTRRPVWFAMKRFMAACQPMKKSVASQIERKGLPETMRDLAVATPDGFTYCIWQETAPSEWKTTAQPVDCTVRLKSSDGRALKCVQMLDPISGKEISQAHARRADSGELAISLPVTDYPRLCLLKLL